MRTEPIDLLGGFYADESRPWSAQDTVNWIPGFAEVPGTRTRMKLEPVPGLKPFADLANGPIRGLHNAEGALFAVSGNKLYEVSTKATSTARGIIPGVTRVQMAHNQITGGNQLLVVNGQSGYVWDSVAGNLSRITDDGYPGAKSAAYIDSYLLQVEPFGRFWFHSVLADAKSYNTLDRYESEASPDKIVTLAVSQKEVVVFNQTTIEFFYNSGSNTKTFKNKGVLVERGCASGDTVVRLDNSLMWLGDDGVVYRLNGYEPVPISTTPIQNAIRAKNWSQAFAFAWEGGRHKVYYLTFPDGQTWGYDVVTKLWHRRQSYGLTRWRLNHLVKWNGMWIGGDFQSGKLWVVDDDYMLEGDQPLVSERISGVVHDDQNRINVNYIELLMGMGTKVTTASEAATPPPSTPPPSGSQWQMISKSNVAYKFTPDPYANSSSMNDSEVYGARYDSTPQGDQGWVLNITGSGNLGVRIKRILFDAQDGSPVNIKLVSASGTETVANSAPAPTTTFMPISIERTLPVSSGIQISINGLRSAGRCATGWSIEVLTKEYKP